MGGGVEPIIVVEGLMKDVVLLKAHQLVSGWRWKSVASHEMGRTVGLSSTSWEREADLQQTRRVILMHWAGTPIQRGRSGNQPYLRMRQSAALR